MLSTINLALILHLLVLASFSSPFLILLLILLCLPRLHLLILSTSSLQPSLLPHSSSSSYSLSSSAAKYSIQIIWHKTSPSLHSFDNCVHIHNFPLLPPYKTHDTINVSCCVYVAMAFTVTVVVVCEVFRVFREQNPRQPLSKSSLFLRSTPPPRM